MSGPGDPTPNRGQPDEAEDAVEKDAAVPVSAPAIVPLAAFDAVDFETPLVGMTHCDAHSLADIFRTLAANAQEMNDYDAFAVFRLLNGICSIHLKADDRASPWGPMFSSTQGRSMVPDDLRGEQAEILGTVLERAKHPTLRARIGDLLWSIDRKRGTAAAQAIEAYCECAEGLMSEQFAPAYGIKGLASLEAETLIQRALQLAYATGKKGAIPDRVKKALENYYQASIAEAAFVPFERAAEHGLYYQLFDEAQVAKDAERVASAATEGQYAMAVRGVWELGARLYDKLGDREGKRRCQMGALEQILAMRKQVGTAGVEAHWVMEALRAARHIADVEELEDKLERDLRRLQKASIKEFGTFKIDLDVGGDRAAVIQRYEALDLADALLEFASLDIAFSQESLREEALKSFKQNPLSSLFATAHVDGEGRTVSKSPGAPFDGKPDDAWFLTHVGRLESIHRAQVVAGRIDPARTMIAARFNLAERHLLPIVQMSPFVPPSQRYILALGFLRLLQGDFMSAVYLIIPQLEPCLRHILRLNGYEPTRRYADGTEEDMDLGSMLGRMRKELEQVFGADIVAQIERLFDARPGPRLRHELAHGHVSAHACFAPDLVYGTWLIYRLTALFLAGRWAELVGPAVAAEL